MPQIKAATGDGCLELGGEGDGEDDGDGVGDRREGAIGKGHATVKGE